MTKYILGTVVIAASLTFSGCTKDQETLALAGVGVAAVAVVASSYHKDGSHTGDYYHNDNNYGSSRNYNYRDGVRDGCDSRTGSWRQNTHRYDEYQYRHGWQAGYKRCR